MAKTSLSTNLNHNRVAKPADTLPDPGHEIHGDSKRYLAVARENDLGSLTVFTPGDILIFPLVRT